ncbi:transcriptional regulator [Catellatospora sp. IY07-71]|uniref:ROK family protein n=1 Tax=Catellatospora sp. IY07-71 TaxID=2728827 RepID=UPI001BB43723|nr:ROK family protein [Catellatospora sp. IY07-71]BCJ75799.1 transcriptional regulator [Catellatospora sp. IY07-71]
MSPGPVVAAIDIGGTKTAAALVHDGQVLARAQAPTPVDADGATVLQQAAALVNALRADSPLAPVAFGAAVAGVVDGAGVVHAATGAIGGWDGTAVTASLTALLGLPGRSVNDVHAFVLGETAYGSAAGLRDVVGIAVGTGIGGGVVSGGRLITGSRGAAGHLGHIPVAQAAGLPCPCGAPGHLEAVASGPAMAARYAAQSDVPVQPGSAALPEAIDRRGAVTLPDVVAAARAGDALAVAVLAEAGAALGAVIGGLINTFDPAAVVVGGGAAVPELLAAAVPAAHAAAMPIRSDVPVLATALDADAALLGAAAVALEPQ